MLSKRVALAIAVILAIVIFAEAREEGPHDMADAIRMLQELDRLYTQAARPRSDYESDNSEIVQKQKSGGAKPKKTPAKRRPAESAASASTGRSVSKARIDRRDVAGSGSMDPHSLDRAVRLVQLWKLDNMYSYKTRPRNRRRVNLRDKDKATLQYLHDFYYPKTRSRFGKRSDSYSNWAKDVEKPDLPAWLQYARRR